MGTLARLSGSPATINGGWAAPPLSARSEVISALSTPPPLVLPLKIPSPPQSRLVAEALQNVHTRQPLFRQQNAGQAGCLAVQ
jgi:hypothetical protein